MEPELKTSLTVASFSLFALIGLIILAMWGCPKYRVYSARKEGEAILAHAQSSREVAVAEARAKMEAAAMLAQAEIIRAKGVDSAVLIIGGGLNNNPSYLRYLFIQELKETSNQIIYLPTEAGLPILESQRFKINSLEK